MKLLDYTNNYMVQILMCLKRWRLFKIMLHNIKFLGYTNNPMNYSPKYNIAKGAREHVERF